MRQISTVDHHGEVWGDPVKHAKVLHQWDKEDKLPLAKLAQKIYHELVKTPKWDFDTMRCAYGVHVYRTQPTAPLAIRESYTETDYPLAQYWQRQLGNTRNNEPHPTTTEEPTP
jgi:hypothetical protein